MFWIVRLVLSLGLPLALALWLALCAGLVAAQEPPPRDLDPVAVTATKLETRAEQLGASVTVVPGDDVQRYHYETVEDVLRTVPGVDIRRSGSIGKFSNISIRGANSNQVQVLVDGVRVKSPTLGQADLSDISPDLIERIEVIRGPQSTLYGADAIGGVVNIITKKGTGPFSATTENTVGNYDTFQNRLAINGTWKIVSYSLYGSHLESNGQFKNDNDNNNAAGGRIALTLPYDSYLSVTYRYNKNDTGVPVKGVFPPPQPIVPIINPNAKQQTETTVLSAEAGTHPVTWWEAKFRFGRYTNNQGFQDPVDPGFDFDTPIEDNSVFGTATTGQGSVLFVIKETGTRLRASAGTGFRAPTFNDLFFPDFGNPNLLPERSQTWDAGFDQSLWQDRIRLKFTWFATHFTNLITCCVVLPTAPFGGPVNAGKARSKGVESSAEFDLLPNLVLSMTYTYTDTDNLSTGRPLPRIPRNAGSAGLTWEPMRRLSLFTQVYAISNQFDSYGKVYNSGHTRWDAGGTYRLLEKLGWVHGLDLVARAQNILNESY